jgi:4'-phosphopantetheinyl transferase EntD
MSNDAPRRDAAHPGGWFARRLMTPSKCLQLQRSLEALVLPGVRIGHRLISEGDEHALLREEREAFASSVVRVRRASGAARMVARELLVGLGHLRHAIPKSASGVPVWPAGIVGSLAHDAEVAVAAVALRRDYSGLGIDVEPNEPLDRDLVAIVATAAERRRICDDPHRARLLFAIKEAVYKTVYPLDGRFLEHHDVEVCLNSCRASVQGGRVINFRVCVATHIVAVATLPPMASAERS